MSPGRTKKLGEAPSLPYESDMSKLLDFLRNLLPGRKAPTTQRRLLVCVDLSAISERPEGGHAFALGLHDAMTRRGIGCAIIDAEEWLLDTAVEAGHFRHDPDGDLPDALTGRPRWERQAKVGIGWLMRHRTALLRSAFSAGGDAEVVVVLHQQDFLSLLMSVDLPPGHKWWIVSLHPADPGSEGFVAFAPGKDFGPPVRFGANGLDDLHTWERLATRLVGKG